MAKRQRPELNYPADQVWSAAAAAYRINSGYLKYPEVVDGRIVRPTNRELVQLYLTTGDRDTVTDADRQHGFQCRQTLKNSVTMLALRGQLTEWNLLVARMTAVDTVQSEYEISVISALPKSYDQVVARENTDSRLAHCDSAPIGRVNERVNLKGEVVKCNYSMKFQTFYTTVITASNQQVFFAYRERLAVGQHIRFGGRVKRHAGPATQLSRVKLEKQEAV